VKKTTLCVILTFLVLALPQIVSTSPGSGGIYVFELKWGSYGSGDSQFNEPRSVAVDSNGYVYVADTINHRIQKFDSFGGFLGWWGLDDMGVTGWHGPATGRTGSRGSGNGQFDDPWGVCVDSNDNIYVADKDNHRIQKFDSTGTHLATLGSYGSGNGQFNRPRGVAVDSVGNIYVADTNNHRIQKLNSFGGFILKWGSFGFSGAGVFWFAGDVAVDSGGNVYVADSFNDRIQKFNSNGIHLATLGSYGSGDDQFNTPWGVGVDSDDNMYVADTSNNRIKKYNSLGVFLGWWGYDYSGFTGWHPPGTLEIGRIGIFDGQFFFPSDMAVDSDGTIFVADSFMDRIQKIDLVPPLGVTSPNGGEELDTNTTHVITWEPGVGNVSVMIDFSVDNGTNWEEIVASTDNDGSYAWDVPCDLSDMCLVRITGLDDYSFDESDAVFSIKSGTPPVITLIGLPELYLECGIDTYTEDGATAEDGCLNDVPVDIGGDTVDTMTCGTYVVTYDAIDSSGQAATQETRSVIVRDTNPPVPDVETLPDVRGECSVTITTSPTATDNCAGPITGTTTDPLSYNKRGTYTVLWTYDDGNGYTATQTQTVTVEDTTPPVPDAETLPTVTGECSADITTHPTATDNCAGSITGTTSDPLKYTEQGTHTVTWTYDDGNGNTTTQTQTVTVEDVTPPTIHLSDSDCVDVKKWVKANMLTVSASDNCTSDVEAVIDKIKVLNRRGRRVWGRGVYNVVGNDIYVFPRGRDWSIRVTVTAADANGNTTTATISKPLLKCNRWSGKMARLIRLLYILMWKMHRCW
jgi:hypothetical protein